MPLPASSDAQAIDTIARTAWGECRGGGEQGMQAVINVIMNRVAKQSWYGLNPVAVCLKSCQFSAWDKGDVNRAKLIAVTEDDPQFATALKLARMAISGDLPDVTGGAVSYYATGIDTPSWVKSMVFTVQLGHHRFYKMAS